MPSPGASFGIRRELWERLGGFDETLFMYYEETDLSWRASVGRLSVSLRGGVEALHDLAPGTPGDARLYYNPRNRMLLLLKHWHVGTLLLLSPALLVAEVLDWGLALENGWRGVRAKGKGYWWIGTHVAELRRMRVAPAERRLPDAALLRLLAANVRPATGSIRRPGAVG